MVPCPVKFAFEIKKGEGIWIRRAWPAFLILLGFVHGHASIAWGAEEQFAAGDLVTVDFANGETRSCRFTHYSSGAPETDRVRNLFCPPSGSGPELLIHEQSEQWVAAGATSDGRIISPAIVGVSTSDQVLFAGREFPTPDDDTLSAEMGRINRFRALLFGSAQSRMAPLQAKSWLEQSRKLYEELGQRLDARADVIFANYLDAGEVVVEFVKGGQSTCRRGGSLSGFRTSPCELFVCDPMKIGDELYQPLLTQTSDPASGNRPLVSARGITSDAPAAGMEVRSVKVRSSGVELYRKSPSVRSLREVYSRILPPELMMDDFFLAGTEEFFQTQREHAAGRCEGSQISEHMRWESEKIQAFRDRLKKVPLAVLVDVVDGLLKSEVIPSFLLPPGVCHLEGDLFFTPSGFRGRFGDAPPAKPAKGILSEEEAQEYFRKVAGMKDIPFDYVSEGCFARAHVMAHRLEKLGLAVEKIWAKGGALRPRKEIRWEYHVAPAVWVQGKDGDISRRVFDPSLADRPLTPEQWLARFHDEARNGRAVRSGWPGPADTLLYNRTLLYFSPWEVYAPFTTQESHQASLQNTLDHAAEVNSKYLEVLAEQSRSTTVPNLEWRGESR